MQHYKSTIENESSSSIGDCMGGSYHGHSNGHSEHSPNSSHISLHSDEPLVRSHKSQSTVNKVVRDVQQLGGDGQEYVSVPLTMYPQYMEYGVGGDQSGGHHMYSHLDGHYGHGHYQDYEQYPPSAGMAGGVYGGASQLGDMGQPPLVGYVGHGLGYEPRSGSPPPSPSERSGAPSPQGVASHAQPHAAYGYVPDVHDLPDHYRVVTPEPAVVYGYVSAASSAYAAAAAAAAAAAGNGPTPLRSLMYESDLDMAKLSLHGHVPRSHALASPGPPPSAGAGSSLVVDDDQRGMRWRDPNLTEVIGFLNNPNNVIKANAAAYLQHLCYMDDPNKQKTRALGGIPPLVKLLSHDSQDVFRNACGALRNLSYGRQNDENKRAIKNAAGIPALINLLRKSNESEVKELVTGVIWNMSSCEDLKRAIIDDGVAIIVANIIIPHSGWDFQGNSGETCWSTVFRNASGVLRNVSSAGEYARKKLRECEGLIDALLYVVRCAIEKSNIGNKIVENCVCILRNLSYRCQEVEDPNYDRNPLPSQSRVSASNAKGENLGCFGASKKKKDTASSADSKENASGVGSAQLSTQRNEPVNGVELLWQPEVVQSYLALLQSCSNPETLEAAAGALQNLAACYWQPSIEIRAAVRKEKGLPILVELLRMEVDRVVCAVATALRNLAIDQRNKELIGKYAMRDLVQKLPSGNPQHDQGTSDDTIAAVLATLNEVIKKNAEFSRSLLEAGGVERLMTISRQRQRYTPRVLKFSGQVLFTMWQHQELRDVYKKHGWKEQDFVTKTVAARNAGPNSPNNANSTLNRPMASQSGTRYEDRTMKRGRGPGGGAPPPSVAAAAYQSAGVAPQLQQQQLSQQQQPPSVRQVSGDDIPMSDMMYPDQSPTASGSIPNRHYQPGAGPNQPPPPLQLQPPPPNAGEPLYAQVNMDKKKNRQTNVANQLALRTNEQLHANLPAGKDSWV